MTFPIPAHILEQSPFTADALTDDEPTSTLTLPAPIPMPSMTCLMPPPLSPVIGEESETPSLQLVFPGW